MYLSLLYVLVLLYILLVLVLTVLAGIRMVELSFLVFKGLVMKGEE